MASAPTSSLGVLMLVALAPPALGAEYAVRGTHLVVSVSRARVAVVARDSGIMVAATEEDDPTRVGGELLLTIESAAGASTQTFALAAADWSRRDKPFGPSLRFANSDVAVALRRGRWKAKAYLSADLPAGSDIVTVAARVRTGASTWCALFAERMHVGPRGNVTASRQPVPAHICPALGSTSTTLMPTTTVTTSTTTSTTMPGCGCGDAICQAGESQETCFADCRVERAPILPIIVGSCALAAFEHSGNCTDLPASLSIADVGPQPDGSCMWSWGEGTSSADAIAVLPSQCCYGGTCGGGMPAAARHIGDVVPSPEGNITPMFAAMRGCLDAGIDEFVVALADCAELMPVCPATATITGFATVRLLGVNITGNPKGPTFQILCTSDGPCGLGVCPADCGSCPVDCGGCAPPCSET